MKCAIWIATIFLLIVLLANNPVNAQKRRKGDKKKETEVTTIKSDAKSEGGGKQRGRTTSTTTTTAAPTIPIIVEEELEEEMVLGNLPTLVENGGCPPELKAETGKTIPCKCIDNLEENALMVECVALTSAQDMHLLFEVIT